MMRSYFVSACGTEEMLRLRPYIDAREPGTEAPWDAAKRRAKGREEQAQVKAGSWQNTLAGQVLGTGFLGR